MANLNDENYNETKTVYEEETAIEPITAPVPEPVPEEKKKTNLLNYALAAGAGAGAVLVTIFGIIPAWKKHQAEKAARKAEKKAAKEAIDITEFADSTDDQ